MALTHADVQEILRIIENSPYEELTLDTARFRLELRRGEDGGWSAAHQTLTTASLIGGNAAGAPATSATPASPVTTPATLAAADVPGTTSVRTSLPGTFYRAPKPGADPYVEPGAKVTPDSVVGIVETMKLMTPVHAGVSGVVDSILVGNGELVVKGQVLVRVRDA
jgi:acetyl-CoA carboxylase biotin carboxyl carrier protein